MAMTTFCFSLLSLLLIPALVFGYQPHEPVARREALQTFLMGSSAFFAVKPALAVDVLRSKGCYQGQGEACAELATDNALIKSLQAKSFANREKNEKEARDAYYMKNYPDWFATVGKVMIKKPDGTFMIVSDMEANELKKRGKLIQEIPKAKGGKLTDYTQKPILVLKE